MAIFRQFIQKLAASKVAVSLGISLVIAILAMNTDLYRVEAYLYDLRMRWKNDEALDNRIVVLALGEKPGKERTEFSEFHSIESHLSALKVLLKSRPSAIAYINKFDSAEIESKPKVAEEFVKLSKDAESKGTKILMGTDVDLSGEVLSAYPLSLLPHAPAILHKDGTMFGEDKVMRRGLLTVLGEPSLHYTLAYPHKTKEELLNEASKLKGSYFYSPADSWHLLIRYPFSTKMSESKFPVIYFDDVKDGKVELDLKDKIILVETLRKDAMNDYAYTPYSRVTYTNPRLFVHASILDTILKDQGIIAASKVADSIVTFLFALSLAFIAIGMSPSRGVMALVLFSIGLFGFSQILFQLGVWLPLSHPFIAMFFTYYLIVPYRAILEYKKRWEVQEKHDLLIQVEELKGNFLSLMSHDLKTPVARIQGLAEMIARQGNLSDEQQSEIQQIIQSTENLDKFISKILNLTKVESNQLTINKKSKDINKIIEQCVHKLTFQADKKKIEIIQKLEPLFPIKLDAALIIQVVSNMIDNAIKYSPEGSTIVIQSKEVKDYVEIMVSDNGTGLSNKELDQLFTKFYRGESHPGDQTKGSGLGLYLSKYFIELHKGSVEAISEKGKGSRFTIKLPIKEERI
ncbi:MAG: ATP-binding protein [Oligoflexia bacterium]|nr:ATP-binding protein [Oligoflexia bacterium]